ncbi:hypothetical protein BDV96DRAFT_644116 [Lophiotrema nucula]|uniref:Uncharacterized protein n=1 Tax=Lophiotrema nucula TaxID=690887 RepID=A0A6A5ZGC2_9PLEO|nr:hypothetical protein BDV96DRAFT_644116 [Lophiotrema nucula]
MLPTDYTGVLSGEGMDQRCAFVNIISHGTVEHLYENTGPGSSFRRLLYLGFLAWPHAEIMANLQQDRTETEAVEIGAAKWYELRKLPSDFMADVIMASTFLKTAIGQGADALKALHTLNKYSTVFATTLKTPGVEAITLDDDHCNAEVLRMLVKFLKCQVYNDLEKENYDVDEKELDEDWNLVAMHRGSSMQDMLYRKTSLRTRKPRTSSGPTISRTSTVSNV